MHSNLRTFSTFYLNFYRIRKEQRDKKVAGDAFMAVYQWTKVVLVEKQKEADGRAMLEPKVTIEKKKRYL